MQGSSPNYVQDPAWLPLYYHSQRDSLTFAHLPRAVQRSMTFIDPRFAGGRATSADIPVSQLSERAVRDKAGPLHFVFHTSFCCSTLLARALDISGVSMGIKEPSVLAFLADNWANRHHNVGAFEALSTTLNLLSRPLAPGETQIVKPSTVVNHIIPHLLHTRRDAKAIVLYSGLDTFLRAIARRSVDGRIFARHMFRQFSQIDPLDSGYRNEDAALLSDLQIAARAWLMQIAFLEQIAKRFGLNRVRVLNADTFLADPAATLLQIGAFFNLRLTTERAQKVANSDIFREHAKELGRPFDAIAQRAQNAQADAAFHDELLIAKEWASALARYSNATLNPEETLHLAISARSHTSATH